jgi:LPXTG-site transpeptidase (sortase) family protein
MTKQTILKPINNILLLLILLINGYVIIAPLVPAINYQIAIRTSTSPLLGAKPNYSHIDRSHNHLIIPKIVLDQPVLVGDNSKLVNQGIWHIPGTTTPDHGSNTVLAGHRWTYYGAGFFYNIDKIRTNDTMVLVWSGKIYVYKVANIATVPPSDTAVNAPSSKNMLTIYSCTPLWNAANRLIVTGSLQKIL